MRFYHNFVCKGTAMVRVQNGSRWSIQMNPWRVKMFSKKNMWGGLNTGILPSGKNIMIEKATVFVFSLDSKGGEHFVKKEVFRNKNTILDNKFPQKI